MDDVAESLSRNCNVKEVKDDADAETGCILEGKEGGARIERANLTHLSADILRLVVDFSNDGNSLTATNRYFYNIRRQWYLKLNKAYSLKYYDDEAFRTLVHSRVENPSKLLSLNLFDCNNITDVNALCGVHALDLFNCQNITDVSALGNIHTLTLSRCHKITDVSALGGVHNLDLSLCYGITDVKALGGVHTLDLSYCRNITDVSGLGGVHVLDLSGCKQITDVSALRWVHTLTLNGCSNITDVSALGGVHTLNLVDCSIIKNIPNIE